jgi:hypothetical protein
MRLSLVLLALILLGAGASAFGATGGQEPSEPPITAGSVLRLTSAQSCVAPSRITARAVAPAGVEFKLLRVAVDGQLATRMSGVRGVASITVRIPRGRAHVRVTVRTAGGQEVHANRSYRVCAPVRPVPQPPDDQNISRGGGED